MKQILVYIFIGLFFSEVHAMRPVQDPANLNVDAENIRVTTESEHVPPRTFSEREQQIINEYLSANYYGLSDDLKLDVRSYIRDNIRNPVFPIDCFWNVVGAISDPLSKLSAFACGIIGGLSLTFENGSNNATRIGAIITTVMGGSTGLFVGITSFTKNEVDDHQRIILSLNEIWDRLQNRAREEDV